MAQMDVTDLVRGDGKWVLQEVVAASTENLPPFTVLLTFDDGFHATVNLHNPGSENLGVVLQDADLFRELFVDSDLGTIAWPNGYDYDPDMLRLLAIRQHPDDPAAIPAPPV